MCNRARNSDVIGILWHQVTEQAKQATVTEHLWKAFGFRHEKIEESAQRL